MKDRYGHYWLFDPPPTLPPAGSIYDEFDALYFADDEIQQFTVALPFSSLPVWPSDAAKALASDYSWATCCKCDKALVAGEYFRLCLCFTVVQHPSLDYEVYWRPRLSCCDEVFGGVHFEFVMCVEALLKPVFEETLRSFRFKPRLRYKKRCYVCEGRLPCDDEICQSLLASGAVPVAPSCTEYMHALMNCLLENKVDILSPLIEPGTLCDCGKRVNPEVYCKSCRFRGFCSKKCRALHPCQLDFLKIWQW